MARIFGTVLILAGCAGFLYKWAEGEKARQRMAGEWIRLFVRWEYALEHREHKKHHTCSRIGCPNPFSCKKIKRQPNGRRC